MGYAACNQLLWAGFPSVCPAHLMPLGAGFIACFINLGEARCRPLVCSCCTFRHLLPCTSVEDIA